MASQLYNHLVLPQTEPDKAAELRRAAAFATLPSPPVAPSALGAGAAVQTATPPLVKTPPAVQAAAPKPLSAAQRGVRFRQSVIDTATGAADASYVASQAAGAAVKQGVADIGFGPKPPYQASAPFLRGVITGRDPESFSTGPYAGQSIPSAAGFQREFAGVNLRAPRAPAAPAAPTGLVATSPPAPSVVGVGFGKGGGAGAPFATGSLKGGGAAIAPAPVAPVVTTPPPGAFGPPAPGPGLPPVPEGSVQVIRGTSVSNDRDGLSIPVGLEGETGRLAAGFKNLGLGGEEIPPAIVAQQGATSEQVRAQAAQTAADAALINARSPVSDVIYTEDPAQPGQALAQQLITNADGSSVLRDLGVRQYRPISDTQAVVSEEVLAPDGYNKLKVEKLVDRRTGKDVRAGQDQDETPQLPPDIAPKFAGEFQASFAEARKRRKTTQEAYDIARRAVLANATAQKR